MTQSSANSDARHHTDELPPHEVVLRETNWGASETAFGSGEDLPEVLMRLLEPDAKVQVTALRQLTELVNHQNSIYEATAPTAAYVAGILNHPAAMTRRPYRNVPMRATLLKWLRSVVDDASDDVIARTKQFFPDFRVANSPLAALRDMRPMLYQAVVPFLNDSHEDVYEAAATTAVILAEHPALAENRGPLTAHALRLLDTSHNVASRRIAWSALDTWGHDLSDLVPPEEPENNWALHSDDRVCLEPPF